MRPRYSVLGSERANLMPSLISALSRYFAEPDLGWKKLAAPNVDIESDLAA